MNGTAFVPNVAFQRLIDGLEVPLVLSTPRSFDLVFEGGLPVSVSLHPNGTDVAIDVWCYDAAPLTGAARRTLVKALLLMNQATLSGQALRIGMDSRGLILVHASQALERLQAVSFVTWLSRLVEQGRRVRALLSTHEGGEDAGEGSASERERRLH
ncbi:hypothetical protein [Ottowia thiooxydans]|uniref:hypothetical protein n=1 Tax=Ottowia thiooxydans TaxID=219182 RepID=UPI00041D0EC1|nr:hypothetical protein [Ottowia thiooxydans]